jgi:hypothetical protein
MNNRITIGILAIAMSLLAANGQDPGGPPPPRGGGPGREGRHPPLIAALDANGDGVIDAQEIASASAALKKLDINADGKLTAEEYHPAPPGGQGGLEGHSGRPGGKTGGDRQGPPAGPGGPPGDPAGAGSERPAHARPPLEP